MSSAPETPTPSPAVQALGRLVGAWTVTGGATGQVVYEPLEGGHFLIQRVELEHYGQPVIGLEVIPRRTVEGVRSPAYFEGKMNADGSTLAGEWVYPGGGSYPSTMTRADR